LSFVLVGLNHWVAKGETWGDHMTVHRAGCREAREGWYGVEWVAPCETIEDAALNAFGDFIDTDLEEDDCDYMTLQSGINHLTMCDCTKEGANFCDQSKCKNCGKTIYDLDNAVWTEWWSDDDCGCTRGMGE